MAVKFRNGEHHRNPSGFYNKVNFLLIKSERNPEKLYQIFGDISYHRNGIDNKYFHTIKDSWEDAYKLAKWSIENNIENPKDYINSIRIMIRKLEKIGMKKNCLK